MLTLQILVVLSLLVSVFNLYTLKKQDEALEVFEYLITYITAFLQSEHDDFGNRDVKLQTLESEDNG